MKTHKGAAKRFKRTGTGKIMHRKAWHGHNKYKKSSSRSGGNEKRVDRLLSN
jgi:large subunit ribosomal protein L35